MSEYGLPDVRDKDGELQDVDHSFEWSGDEITIKLIPPTISQQEKYESLGEDVDADQLREIVDEHIVKPEIGDDLTMRETLCYVEGIVDYSTGGADLHDEIRQELESRQGESGN